MAKVQSKLLTDVQIRMWVRTGLPIAKSDGGGLTFTLSPAGTAAWILRFQHGGRRQELTLGRYPDMPLAVARTTSTRKRLALLEGITPANDVRKAKAHRAQTVIYGQISKL